MKNNENQRLIKALDEALAAAHEMKSSELSFLLGLLRGSVVNDVVPDLFAAVMRSVYTELGDIHVEIKAEVDRRDKV